MDENNEDDVNFNVDMEDLEDIEDIEDLDGWEEVDNNEGWEDLYMDDEMKKMLEEIEERNEFDRNEFERGQTDNDDKGNDEDRAALKDYLLENRNKNTVKKTEQVMKKFRWLFHLHLPTYLPTI